MNVEETKISLLHSISTNVKGKLIWTGTFQSLQQFVEDILNMSDGIWGCPGDHDKRYKSEKIDMRWYPDTKSIILNGALKEEIKAKLESLASVSKGLANAKDQNKIPDDRNEKEIHVNHECGLGNDSRNLSLEAFKSQLQTLSKRSMKMNLPLKIF